MRIRSVLLYTIPWLAVIAFSLGGSYFNAVLFDTPFHIRQELPFIARWIVWMPLTPMALFLAGKVYYAGNEAGKFFAYHFSIYLLLCTVHVFLASLTALLINQLLGQAANYYAILEKCALTGIFFNFIVYSLMLLLLNGMQYYTALQAEKTRILHLEKSLSDTRLQFLKQQLQPHFLFNTHHSIITLIKMGEKEKAIAMLEKLSDLMRIALREAGDQVIPLSRELETLQLYVDIQQTRFEDKMAVQYNIDEKMQQALVPSMILQPLVENSIKYAVERSSVASRIVINASHDDNKLTLSIKDTGSSVQEKQEIKRGTGLSNSIERLNKLYGAASFFSINPYTDHDAAGMEVIITIPLQYANI